MNNLGETIAPLKFEVFKKTDDNLYWEKDNVVGVTNEKAIGILYIDDRALHYDNSKDTYYNIEQINKTIKELGGK